MSTRQHWQGHAISVPAQAFELDARNKASVYSAKNEGEASYVLMSLFCVGFSADAKFTPEAARLFAYSLRAAADAAEEADSLYPSTP